MPELEDEFFSLRTSPGELAEMWLTSLSRPASSRNRPALLARRRRTPRPRPAPPPRRDRPRRPTAPLGRTLTRSRGRSSQATPPLSRTFHMPAHRSTSRPPARPQLAPAGSSQAGTHGPPRPRHGVDRQGPGWDTLWARTALPLPHGSPGGVIRPRAGAPAAGRTADAGGTAPCSEPRGDSELGHGASARVSRGSRALGREHALGSSRMPGTAPRSPSLRLSAGNEA